MLRIRPSLLAALAFCTVTIAPAQDRGGVTGTVLDPSGSAVAGANIQVVNVQRGSDVSVKASDAGVFSAANLIPGQYRIVITAPGFQTSTLSDVEVRVGGVTRADVRLEVGSVTQNVDVTAQQVALNVDTSDVGTTVSPKAIENLPLQVGGAVRDPLAFARLTPGFTGNTANSAVEYQTYYTVNGGQSGGTQIQVDGADVELTSVQSQFQMGVSVEAVEEFKVMGSNFSAEYGRSTGGIINLNLKSGTNDFHGDLYEFLRNDDFDARGFFNADRAINKQNDFGGLFSGPVWIPKLYKGRDKTFFMFSYEGFRYRAGALNQLGTYPIDAFRSGDFSKLVDANGNLVPIYDPSTTVVLPDGTVTRQQFPGNVVPSSRIDPVAKAIVGLMPPLDYPDRLTNNIFTKNQNSVETNLITVKIDHALTDKQRLTGSYSQGEENNRDNWAFGALGQTGAVDSRSTYARLAHDFVITPTLLNHIQYGFSRRHFVQGTPFTGDFATQLGLKGVNDFVFPLFDISGYILPGGDTFGGGPFGQYFTGVDNSFQITEGLTWVKGKHTLKFGYERRWQEWNVADQQNLSGRFGFGPGETGLPGASQTTGDAFASFLLGAVDSGTWGYEGNRSAHRFRSNSAYIQDDYKVSRRLTLNLGLRYDRFEPLVDATNRVSSFDPRVPNPGAGGIPGALVFAGTGPGRIGYSRFQQIYNFGFGPRIGLAYELDSRTAFRAGYGIFYQELKEPGWGGSNAGFFAQPNFSSPDGFSAAFNLQSGFPQNFLRPPFLDPTFVNGQSISFADPESPHVPTSEQWQASIERQLRRNLVLETSYVATAGHHLITSNKIYNQVDPKYLPLGSLLDADIYSSAARNAGIPIPYAGFQGTVAQALRPYPQYRTIDGADIWGSDKTGNSTYHSLQTKLQGNVTPALTLLAAYTFSKTLTDGSNNRDLDIYAPNFGRVQNSFDRRAEKALASSDIPHNFVASLLYDLPFGPGRRYLTRGIAGAVIGGWTIGGIVTYHSGAPIAAPTPASSHVPLFAGKIRPNVVPGENELSPSAHDNFDPGTDLYLNPAAWSSPAPFSFGNAGRMTAVRTPFYSDEDFSLLKSTSFRETFRVQFRAEAFNVFNRTIFGYPQTNLGSSDFGKVFTQANKPRVLQLGLKLIF